MVIKALLLLQEVERRRLGGFGLQGSVDALVSAILLRVPGLDALDLDAEAQARIVRMMDNPGEHVPRFMATSQVNLSTAMEKGRMRQDLYYRIGGATLDVPALRERVDDISLLAEHFLGRAERDTGVRRRLSRDTLELMRVYSWPGNVRELEQAIRRVMITGAYTGDSSAERTADESLGQAVEAGSLSAKELVEKYCRDLYDTYGNYGEVARRTGLDWRTVKKNVKG